MRYPASEKAEHTKGKILGSLHDDYDVRNDAAHNYKKLPAEARDESDWLRHLEELVGSF